MREVKRCPICKRNKNKAILEQSSQRVACGIAGCVFAEEITKSIEEKIRITIIKKEPKKIRIVKKQ